MSNRKLEDTTIVQNDEITQHVKVTREFFSSDPTKWIQGTTWMDKNGKLLGCSDHPDMHSACLGGALMIASQNIISGGPVYRWVDKKLNGWGAISTWNDKRGRTHQEVVELLNSLIENRIEEIKHV